MRTNAVPRSSYRPVVMVAVVALIAALMPFLPGSVGPAYAPPIAHPTLIYVDVEADGPGSGTADDPFPTITEGLAVAGDGSTIKVAAGDYSSETGEVFPLVVPSGVTIEGTVEEGVTYRTFIFGDGFEAPEPLMTINDAEGVTIKGLVFLDNAYVGDFGAQFVEYTSAGVNIENSSVRLVNCGFEGLMSSMGSAVFAFESEVVVEGSTFVYNGTYDVVPFEAEPEIADVVKKFGLDRLPRSASEVVPQGWAGAQYGGAVAGISSDLTFSNSGFMSNGAWTAGGAVLSYGGTMSTSGCAFVGNHVEELSDRSLAIDDGADVFAQASEPIGGSAVGNFMGDYRCIGTGFYGNVGDPGTLITIGGATEIVRCEFINNSGVTVVVVDENLMAGSLAIEGLEVPDPEFEEPILSSLDIDACEFRGNEGYLTNFIAVPEARITNSLYVQCWNETIVAFTGLEPSSLAPQPAQTPLWVEGCTFSDNYAWSVIEAMTYPVPAVVNSILWNNDTEWAAYGVDIWNCDVDGDIGSDFGADSVEAQWIDEDSMISEDPMFVDPESGDYRLLPDSPCVDTGTDEAPADSGLEFVPRPWDFASMLRPADGDEDGSAVYDMGAFEYTPSGRIGGANRYETAEMISQRYFGSADTVVLATAAKFADALSGSGLAGLYDAPVLLTRPDVLSSEARAEIVRLGAQRVFLLGSEAAISADVEETLLDMGLEVIRIGGIDRYETSELITRYILESGRFALTGPTGAFIARGDQFADALAAAPLAYANGMPVILVRPDKLPPGVVDVWHMFGITSATIVGGEAAVAEDVAAEVRALDVPVERIGGDNRYETAAKLAQWAYDNGLATFDIVGLATGLTFPDALAGGAAVGFNNGVVLLTPMDSLHPACAAAIEEHAEEITSLQVFGGPAALNADVYDAAMEVLSGR